MHYTWQWWSDGFIVNLSSHWKIFPRGALGGYKIYTLCSLSQCSTTISSQSTTLPNCSLHVVFIFFHKRGETPFLLWNLKVLYHVYKSPLLVLILSHMNPVHILPTCFLKIHFNIIFLFTLRSSDTFPFKFSDHNFVSIYHCIHAAFPTNLSSLVWSP